MTDLVNHPPHYQGHPSGIECIDLIENLPHCIASAWKYLYRAGKKDGNPPEQDLRKAIWYLNREIERRSLCRPEAVHTRFLTVEQDQIFAFLYLAHILPHGVTHLRAAIEMLEKRLARPDE